MRLLSLLEDERKFCTYWYIFRQSPKVNRDTQPLVAAVIDGDGRDDIVLLDHDRVLLYPGG
jgi:hypothetical protein